MKPDKDAVYAAAEKLVRCKGRYHAELNYKSLAELFGVKTHNVTEPVLPDDVCEWHYDEQECSWSAKCGSHWLFYDGGPVENDVKFCQCCGKPVKIAAPEALPSTGK